MKQTVAGHNPMRLGDTLDDGRYEVRSVIGAGGMGLVYSAIQTSMDREVAIKVLKSSLSEDSRMVKRFEQEALSVSRIKHPNVVTIFDYGQTESGQMFMVMERLEGESLHDHMKNEGLTSRQAIELFRQICDAVQEAHSHGVIHRDLKPENIYVERLGTPRPLAKVLDFGIAKIIQGEGQDQTKTPLTQAGVVFGTPHYMSPEQIHGHAVDERSDIYALGVILYEMISGRVPFAGASTVEAMLAQVSQPFPDLRVLCPQRLGIDEMAQLIADCTAKDSDARLGSLCELVGSLNTLLEIVIQDEATVRSVQMDEDQINLGAALTDGAPAVAYDFAFSEGETLAPSVTTSIDQATTAAHDEEGDLSDDWSKNRGVGRSFLWLALVLGGAAFVHWSTQDDTLPESTQSEVKNSQDSKAGLGQRSDQSSATHSTTHDSGASSDAASTASSVFGDASNMGTTEKKVSPPKPVDKESQTQPSSVRPKPKPPTRERQGIHKTRIPKLKKNRSPKKKPVEKNTPRKSDTPQPQDAFPKTEIKAI